MIYSPITKKFQKRERVQKVDIIGTNNAVAGAGSLVNCDLTNTTPFLKGRVKIK